MNISSKQILVIAILICFPHRIGWAGDPGVYEPDVDPGVGFNLISWWNYGASGASIWENAVQSIHDAGFDEVSISPVRFVTLGTGSIATTSSQGPELSHVAAGIARAKSLGMRVTVNPFVEPQGFSMWRGLYDPTPGSGEWTTFWDDYEDYMVDVALVAEANGADSMTVGTEYRAIVRNSGNNGQWNTVINAIDSNFSGTLGYAANWDNYQNNNLQSTIWEHPAIDFIGIDSYFTGLLNNGQADASGSYPNPTFIGQVESAWNDKLDNEILPYAAARKSGAGMPVEFTEVGYLPYNRTTVNPQNSGGSVDSDEQTMAYEGLMRALDGRKDEFLAAHIWTWGMPGTGSNLWDMGLTGEQNPNNLAATQWLSDFVANPVDPPDGATQVLYSFEDGLEGFFYPNFETEPASILSQSTTGATDGNGSLAITKPTSPWTWDARVEMNGEQLQALQNALADDIGNYVLELDVTYVADDLPGNLSDMNLHVSFQPSPNNTWTQAFSFADIDAPVDQTFRVEIPLTDFSPGGALVPGITGSTFHIGFAGSWTGEATVYVDRVALTDTTFVVPEDADFDGDGDVDGQDFLAWQRGFGSAGGLAQGDANGDGTIDEADLAIWHDQYGEAIGSLAASGAAAVPEPASTAMIMIAGVVLLCHLRRCARSTRLVAC